MKNKKLRLMITRDFHEKSLGLHFQLALVWAAATIVVCFMSTIGAAATPQVVQAVAEAAFLAAA